MWVGDTCSRHGCMNPSGLDRRTQQSAVQAPPTPHDIKKYYGVLAPLMGQGAHGQGELAHGHWYIHILWPWHLMQPWPWPPRGQGRSYSTRINVYGGGCGICLPWDTLYNLQHAVYNTAHTPVPLRKFHQISKLICSYFMSYKSDHYEILHMPRQLSCLGICKIS